MSYITRSLNLSSNTRSWILVDGRESGNLSIRGLPTKRREELYKSTAELISLGELLLMKTGSFQYGDEVDNNGIAYNGFASWPINPFRPSEVLSLVDSMVFEGNDLISPVLDTLIKQWEGGLLSLLLTEEWDMNGIDLSNFKGDLLLIQIGDFHPPFLPESKNIHLRTWADVLRMRANRIPLVNWRASL